MKKASPRKSPAVLPLPEKENGKAGRIAQSARKPASTQGERAEDKHSTKITMKPNKTITPARRARGEHFSASNKPSPIELIQVAQALPAGQWRKGWASQSYAERRNALSSALREARHVWQVASEICQNEERFFEGAAARDAELVKWMEALNDKSPKVNAARAAIFLEWTSRKLAVAWGRHVPFDFKENQILSESFLLLLKAHEQRRERGKKAEKTSNRRARQRASQINK